MKSKCDTEWRSWECQLFWHLNHKSLLGLTSSNKQILEVIDVNWVSIQLHLNQKVGKLELISDHFTAAVHVLPKANPKQSLICFLLAGGNEAHLKASLRLVFSRVGICHSRHSRQECKNFASGVNFSRNNAIYNRNESTKYILYWFHL